MGYLGFNGDMDLAIAYTAVIKMPAYAGGAASADSVLERMGGRRTRRAVLRAAEMAQAGLNAPGNSNNSGNSEPLRQSMLPMMTLRFFHHNRPVFR